MDSVIYPLNNWGMLPLLFDLFILCLKVCVREFVQYAKSVLKIKVSQAVLLLLTMFPLIVVLAELQKMVCCMHGVK